MKLRVHELLTRQAQFRGYLESHGILSLSRLVTNAVALLLLKYTLALRLAAGTHEPVC